MYEAICGNNALLKEAEHLFEERAIRNGYNREYVKTFKRKKAFKSVQHSNLNVRIVQQPQASLKDLLVESQPHDKACKDVRKCPVHRTSPIPVQCSQKDIVYQVNCNFCRAT